MRENSGGLHPWVIHTMLFFPLVIRRLVLFIELVIIFLLCLLLLLFLIFVLLALIIPHEVVKIKAPILFTSLLIRIVLVLAILLFLEELVKEVFSASIELVVLLAVLRLIVSVAVLLFSVGIIFIRPIISLLPTGRVSPSPKWIPLAAAEWIFVLLLVAAPIATLVSCPCGASSSCGCIPPHAVILDFLFLVAQHTIRGTDLLEFIRRFPACLVRMILLCQLIVLGFDFFFRG